MSSSAEFVPAGFAAQVRPDGWDDQRGDDVPVVELDLPELRTGRWTRHGEDALLGDAVTESILGGIAEQARTVAEAQGYAVGWAQGRREAEAEAAAAVAAAEQARRTAEARREAEHAAAMAALARAAEEARAHLARVCDRVEDEATTLAWALTEALVGREVRSVTGPDVVRRVLAVLPAAPGCPVRIHPDLVGSAAVEELRELGLELIADRTLGPADAVVSADGAVIDLRIAEALNRVRTVLATPDTA
jgi:flagellar assembly protein FliH